MQSEFSFFRLIPNAHIARTECRYTQPTALTPRNTMPPEKRDPATGEQYDPTNLYTELRLQPPLTGYCYDHLRQAIKTALPSDQALLDNILTRLETATRPTDGSIPHPHNPETVQIPIRTQAEARALSHSLDTNPFDLATASSLSQMIQEQLD